MMYICDVKIYLVGRDEKMINFVIMEDNKRHLSMKFMDFQRLFLSLLVLLREMYLRISIF